MSPFSEALAQIMNERGISQRRLAARLGVTPSAVNLWVNGRGISRERVQLLEDELKVEPRGSLLELAGYSANGDVDAPTVESLLRADPGILAEDKRVLLRLIANARARFDDPE